MRILVLPPLSAARATCGLANSPAAPTQAPQPAARNRRRLRPQHAHPEMTSRSFMAILPWQQRFESTLPAFAAGHHASKIPDNDTTERHCNPSAKPCQPISPAICLNHLDRSRKAGTSQLVPSACSGQALIAAEGFSVAGCTCPRFPVRFPSTSASICASTCAAALDHSYRQGLRHSLARTGFNSIYFIASQKCHASSAQE